VAVVRDDSARAERLLYGADSTPRIVAVELANAQSIGVYRRDEEGRVSYAIEPFAPWLLLRDEPDWPRLRGEYRAERLAGDADYRWLVTFRSWSAHNTARALLEDAGTPAEGFRSPVEQYLALTGRTLFKGMVYDDLVRLQFDIETTTLDPALPDARLLLVTIGSNRGHEEAIGRDGEDERTILRRLNEVVAAIDPDIVEGHNVFNFDLPYLLARAEALGVPLTWGRDGSRLAVGSTQRCKVGARSIPYTPHYAFGRHVLDTYQQIQRYDSAGAMTSYGLKESIAALGMTRADRTFVRGEALAATWESDRERVVAYALDDIRDVALLSELAAPTEFYQTQMVPRTFQRVATAGTSGKINALLLRAYLAERHAIPEPAPSRPYPGGWSEIREVGVFRPVVKCDVESLYPAIMLTEGIGAASDDLGVMLPMLRELTTRRLRAKGRARVTSGTERAYWHGLQSSFKLLINSFYGYLGFNRAIFNDYDAAERITLRGQALLRGIVAELERTGARVIEVDTDGVYFVPPPAVDGRDAEEAYVAAVGATLPPGINLAFDGRYRGMISLKTKNYVLMEEDGAITMKGSSLRSRREEPYLRRFLREAAELFIAGSRDAVRERYFATAHQLQTHALPPRDFSRWETVTEKTFRSESNRRLAAAARGQRVGERVEVYQRRDGSLGQAADWDGDEDVTYLLRRLREVAARFADLYEDAAAFDHAFPALTAGSDLEAQRARPLTKQLALF
jgi:DNA polymerase elongation subunit (family B)